MKACAEAEAASSRGEVTRENGDRIKWPYMTVENGGGDDGKRSKKRSHVSGASLQKPPEREQRAAIPNSSIKQRILSIDRVPFSLASTREPEPRVILQYLIQLRHRRPAPLHVDRFWFEARQIKGTPTHSPRQSVNPTR